MRAIFSSSAVIFRRSTVFKVDRAPAQFAGLPGTFFAMLHFQSEDQRVFVCAVPSLFSYHLFVVFLGSEIGENDAGSASLDPERLSGGGGGGGEEAEQYAPQSK